MVVRLVHTKCPRRSLMKVNSRIFDFVCVRRTYTVHSLHIASKATALNAEKSPAIPFLPYPEGCRGYVGDDIGFDPLRISDYVPMDYLRESELK